MTVCRVSPVTTWPPDVTIGAVAVLTSVASSPPPLFFWHAGVRASATASSSSSPKTLDLRMTGRMGLILMKPSRGAPTVGITNPLCGVKEQNFSRPKTLFGGPGEPVQHPENMYEKAGTEMPGWFPAGDVPR